MCRRKSQDSNRGTPSGTPTPTTLSITSRLAGRQPPLRLNHRWSDEKPLSISSEPKKKSVDQVVTPTPSLASSSNNRRITTSDNDIKKSTSKIEPPNRVLHHAVHSFEDVRIAVDSSQLKLDQPEQRRARSFFHHLLSCHLTLINLFSQLVRLFTQSNHHSQLCSRFNSAFR